MIEESTLQSSLDEPKINVHPIALIRALYIDKREKKFTKDRRIGLLTIIVINLSAKRRTKYCKTNLNIGGYISYINLCYISDLENCIIKPFDNTLWLIHS